MTEDVRTTVPDADHPGPSAVTVVAECGSGTCKIGYAGDESPSVYFYTVVGRPRHKEVLVQKGQKNVYVGAHAQARRGILTLIHPVQRGKVENWEEYAVIWRHAMHDELRVEPAGVNLVVPVETDVTDELKRKMLEAIFSSLNCCTVCLAPAPLLQMFAVGRTTGLILDSGEGRTTAVPVIDGKIISSAIKIANLAGQDVTECLVRQLASREISFSTTAEREIAREIKEKLSYVALDYHAERLLPAEAAHATYELPDGQEITLGRERFVCTEILFDADMTGLESKNVVHHLVCDAINDCPEESHETLFKNIILAGGTTSIPGFKERLVKELQAIIPKDTNVTITEPKDCKFLAWAGAANFAKEQHPAEVSRSLWVTKDEFIQNRSEVIEKIEYAEAMVAQSCLKNSQKMDDDEDKLWVWLLVALLLPVLLLIIKYFTDA